MRILKILLVSVALLALTPIQSHAFSWNPIEDLGNAITDLWNDLKKKIPILGPVEDAIFLPFWETAKKYNKDLSREANGQWHELPTSFIVPNQLHYREIDLREVRYATNIAGVSKIGAKAVAWENTIYFLNDVKLDKEQDFTLMLHELEHVVQYKRRGGAKNFLKEYFLKAGVAGLRSALSFGGFNAHGILDFENAARRKEKIARTTFPQYRICRGHGTPVYLKNNARILIWIREASRLHQLNIYSNKCGTVHRPDLGQFEAGQSSRIDITNTLARLGNGTHIVNIEGVETRVYDDPWKAVYEVIKIENGVEYALVRDILGYAERKRRGVYEVSLP